MNSMTFQDAQDAVDQWVQSIGVRYFSELTNLAVLMEEVGELSRLFAREFGDQCSKPGERKAEISEELADILFVLFCLANQTDVDLEKAFIQSINKKTQRDAERHRKNPKLKE